MRKQVKCVTGKKGYLNLSDAHLAINRIMNKVEEGEDRGCEMLRCFKCPACLKYHLTSTPKNEFRAKGSEVIEEVTPNKIRNRLNRLKHKLNKKKMKKDNNWFREPDDNDKREIIRLHNEGVLSFIEIARLMALSDTQVKQTIIDHSKGYN